jgi:hypothetical protein
MAAGYTEVWNPPEASGHAAKPAKKKAGAKVGAGHVASGTHGASPRMTPAAGTARSGKPAAHGGMKKVAAHSTAVHAGKGSSADRHKAKPVVMAQAGKPHAQLAKAKPGQGKTVHASLVQTHAAHPHVSQVAAKPVGSNGAAPVVSANAGGTGGAGVADGANDPATSRSGSLPPIIH